MRGMAVVDGSRSALWLSIAQRQTARRFLVVGGWVRPADSCSSWASSWPSRSKIGSNFSDSWSTPAGGGDAASSVSKAPAISPVATSLAMIVSPSVSAVGEKHLTNASNSSGVSPTATAGEGHDAMPAASCVDGGLLTEWLAWGSAAQVGPGRPRQAGEPPKRVGSQWDADQDNCHHERRNRLPQAAGS